MLETLLNAVVASKRYDLLIHLIALGLDKSTKIIKEHRFDIKRINEGDNYLVLNPILNKWEETEVTSLHEGGGVKRAFFRPVHRTHEDSLFPMWLNLSSHSHLCQLAELSELSKINRGMSPETLDKVLKVTGQDIFHFAFIEDNRALWPYLIEHQIDRDDSVLEDASFKQCAQYILSLNKATLVLRDSCTKKLLERILPRHPLDTNMLALIAQNNPKITKSQFK